MRKSVLRLISIAAIGYAAINTVLYFKQDSLIFVPTVQPAEVLLKQAERDNFSPWYNKAGQQIGWQSNQGDLARPILLFHGNAGHALHRTIYDSMCIVDGAHRKFYILEYPGYGARPGPATEKTLTAAAIEAIDTLNPQSYLWVIGESLGAGVATAAAAARPYRVAGMVLITPFDSAASAAHARFPWLPTSWILKTKFDSSANLAQYRRGPVAFVVAENDTMIPSRLGMVLYESYPGPKKLWLTAGAGHNDTDLFLAQWPAIDKWLTFPEGEVPFGTPKRGR